MKSDLSNGAGSAVSEKAGKVIVWKLFGSLVLDLLAFTVILPLLPTLMDHFAVHDSSGLYAYLRSGIAGLRTFMGATEAFDSVLFGGVLGSLFSLLQFMASPVIGTLSDIFGRKPVFIMTSVGLALSYGLWAVASNFVIFIIARIVGGVSKGNISLAAAIIADVLPMESRGFGMALVGIAFSLGFICGPMLGAVFAMWAKLQEGSDWFAYPAIFSLTLTVANILFLSLVFPETLPEESVPSPTSTPSTLLTISTHLPSFLSKLPEISQRKIPSLAGRLGSPAWFQRWWFLHEVNYRFLTSWRNYQRPICFMYLYYERLTWLGRIYFLFLFVYSGLEFTFSFLTHLRFGFTPRDQGKMFLFVGISMALVQGGLGRRVKKEMQSRVSLISMLVTAPSFFIIGLANSTPMLYFGLFLYAAGSAMVVPSMTTLVSECGPTQRRGIILGNFRSIGALARAIGPLVGSFFQESFDIEEEEEREFLVDRILEDLYEASERLLPNVNLLLPAGTVEEISTLICEISKSEPCGLKGCQIFIDLEHQPKTIDRIRCEKLAKITLDRYTVATFEVHITLKSVQNQWTRYLPGFLRSLSNRNNSIVVSKDYDIQVKKLFR